MGLERGGGGGGAVVNPPHSLSLPSFNNLCTLSPHTIFFWEDGNWKTRLYLLLLKQEERMRWMLLSPSPSQPLKGYSVGSVELRGREQHQTQGNSGQRSEKEGKTYDGEERVEKKQSGGVPLSEERGLERERRGTCSTPMVLSRSVYDQICFFALALSNIISLCLEYEERKY